MLVVVIGIGSLLAGWATTVLMRRYALMNAVLDLPNERSSHHVATPRGGGVGIVLPVVILLLAFPTAQIGRQAGLLGAAAILIVAAIGWLDDHRSLGVKSRLLGHIGAGILVALFGLGAPMDPLRQAIPLVAVCTWWVFWTVSAINVVNFIDGIDGLIGLQAVLFGLFAVAIAGGQATPAGLLGVTLAGAAIGFLLLNWAPARIFMGDVGSGSLGVAFVVLGILTMIEAQWTIVHSFLPLMPIFVDEVLTMGRRVARGEALSEPHRTHVYQRLVQAGLGHATVATLYGFLATATAAWALLVPVSSRRFWIGFVIVLILTFVLLSFLRHWAEARIAVRVSNPTAQSVS